MINIDSSRAHAYRIVRQLIENFSSHQVLWTFLWFVSALSIIDIPGAIVYNIPYHCQILYIVTVSAMKASILLILIVPLIKRHKWFGRSILLIYIFLATMNAFCFKFYDTGITRRLILTIVQTNKNEIREFLEGLINNIQGILLAPLFYLSIIFGTAFIYVFNIMPRKTFLWIAGCMSGTGFIVASIFGYSFKSGKSAHLLTARIIKYSLRVWKTEKEYAKLLAQAPELPHPETVSSSHLAQNIIIIIGESASRDHHSIYGYPLPTTPALDAMRDSLLIFNDAIGSSACTYSNMACILSFMKDNSITDNVLEYPTFVDVFNHAGYKTFWLSNQERTGYMSNISGIMTHNAAVIKYVGAECSEDALQFRYDDRLIAPFRQALSDTAHAKLIFLHLMGSHTSYRSRFPVERRHFNASEEMAAHPTRTWLTRRTATILADYDNSIRFTDSIVAKVIESASTDPAPSIVFYFSDHGKNVYDEGDYIERSMAYTRVPMIIYANSVYRTAQPEYFRQIMTARTQPISTANIIYSVMTLSGTKYDAYDAADDFMSESLSPRCRYVDWKPFDTD